MVNLLLRWSGNKPMLDRVCKVLALQRLADFLAFVLKIVDVLVEKEYNVTTEH